MWSRSSKQRKSTARRRMTVSHAEWRTSIGLCAGWFEFDNEYGGIVYTDAPTRPPRTSGAFRDTHSQ